MTTVPINENSFNWKNYLFVILAVELCLVGVYIFNANYFYVVIIGLVSLTIFVYLLLNKPFAWIILLVITSIADTWGQLPGGITVFHIAWGLAIAGVSVHVLYQHKTNLIFRTPINGFIFAFLVFAFFSLIYSPNKESGIVFILGSIALFVFYIITVNFLNEPKQYFSLVNVLLVGNVAVTIIIIYQILTFDPMEIAHVALSETGEKILRASGTFDDPNVTAAYLMIGILYGLSILIYHRPKIFSNVFLVSTIIISLVGIVLTFSRTAWVSLAIGLIPILYYYKNKKVKWFISLLFVSFLLVFVFFTPYGTFIIERFDSIFDIMGDVSIRNRLSMAISGFEMFLDNPILGVGFRGFPILYDYYVNPLAPQILLNVKESHTLFITLLAELGIIGLVIVLLWFTKVFKDIYSLIKTENNSLVLAMVIGSFANFISFNINCLFYGNLFPHFNFFWLILAIVYSIYLRKELNIKHSII